MAACRPAFASAAQRFVRILPLDEPTDLVRAFATPWALHVAATVTELSIADATWLAGLAREVFDAAAEATDATVPPSAQATTVALARALQAAAGWPDVQAFVALSQTLPCVLAGAWRTLLGQPPAELRGLRAGLRTEPTLAPGVIEELLRHAGPARAVFRQATADVRIGEARVVAGDRVILRLAAANRDPARFSEPERVDLARAAVGHVTFGGGGHRCPGAPVIRLALAVATAALLETTDDIELLEGGTYGGGFAIRSPGALPVRLSRASRADSG